MLAVLDKVKPIIVNPKFLRVLAETQKPLKYELSVSMEAPSKTSMAAKPHKPSSKRSPSIFAEALAPVNPHRWPAFAAESSMAISLLRGLSKFRVN